VVGVDINPAMLSRVHGRAFAAVQADAGMLPLRSETAGAVVSANLLHVVEDPALVLRELARVAAPLAMVCLVWPTDAVTIERLHAVETRLGRRGRDTHRASGLRLVHGALAALSGVRRRRHREILGHVQAAAADLGLTLELSTTVCDVQHLVVLRKR